jgi:hypothetical protein
MNLSCTRELWSRTVLSMYIGVLNEHVASILDWCHSKSEYEHTTFLRKMVPIDNAALYHFLFFTEIREKQKHL